jgi:hypothetical protein
MVNHLHCHTNLETLEDKDTIDTKTSSFNAKSPFDNPPKIVIESTNTLICLSKPPPSMSFEDLTILKP